MTTRICSHCGEGYDDNASHEHVCPDVEQDERIEALEQEVAALREAVIAMLVVGGHVPGHSGLWLAMRPELQARLAAMARSVTGDT